MLFSPQANDVITIGGVDYRFAEHPGLPAGSGYLYEQEGRAATVYQLSDNQGDFRALKVFKFQYRKPDLYRQAELLAPFAALPGLAVCSRRVLTVDTHSDLVQTFPALEFGALMPWVDGRNWLEIVQQREALSAEQSLRLADAFLDILTTLEDGQIAHGDISGPNLILDNLEGEEIALQLVDVEQLYAPSLPRPAEVLGGSPGYAHHRSGVGLWQPDMDRFAGAVLLAEMLIWCDERAREAASGETYFADEELQRDSKRLETLRLVLDEQWGHQVRELFDRAWASNELADCPSFQEWKTALASARETGLRGVFPVGADKSVTEVMPAVSTGGAQVTADPSADVLQIATTEGKRTAQRTMAVIIVIALLLLLVFVLLAVDFQFSLDFNVQ